MVQITVAPAGMAMSGSVKSAISACTTEGSAVGSAVGALVAGGRSVGVGNVVAVGTAEAAASGVMPRVALVDCVGGGLVGVSVALWRAGIDAGVVATGDGGAAVSAGGLVMGAAGAAPQPITSPNMAGRTMTEIARDKIALFIRVLSCVR